MRLCHTTSTSNSSHWPLIRRHVAVAVTALDVLPCLYSFASTAAYSMFFTGVWRPCLSTPLTRTGPCPYLRLRLLHLLSVFRPFPKRTRLWSGYCRAFLPTDDRSRDYNPFSSFMVWMPINRITSLADGMLMQLSLPLLTVTLFTGAISLEATACNLVTRIAQQSKIDGTKTRQRTH